MRLRLRCSHLASWLISLSFTLAPAMAQEVTPDSAPAPSEAATTIADASPTPSATPSPMLSPTASISPSATATATPSPTPTEFAEPSITPENTPPVEPSITPESTPPAEPSITPESTPPAEPSIAPESTAPAEPSITPESTAPAEQTAESTLSADATSTPAPSATALGTPWQFSGQVLYQNRPSHSGIDVRAYDDARQLLASAQSDASGYFTLALPATTSAFTLRFVALLHLPLEYRWQTGASSTLFVVAAGDLDGNACVDSTDLALLTQAYASVTTHADLDGDGEVNAADLALLAGNYGLCSLSATAPVASPTALATPSSAPLAPEATSEITPSASS